jgi:aminopeptidase YwaD
MRKSTILLLFYLLTYTHSTFAQDTVFAKQILKRLCSPEFAGRGCINKGDQKAATYISALLKQMEIKPCGKKYLQPFRFNCNNFPRNITLLLSKDTLEQGIDFLPNPDACSVKGSYSLFYLDSSSISSTNNLADQLTADHTNQFVVIDTFGIKNKKISDLLQGLAEFNSFHAKGYIFTTRNLIFEVSVTENKIPSLMVRRDKLKSRPNVLYINLSNKLTRNYKTNNIVACINGQVDSTIVFSAHYDHLGMIGTSLRFPGANDNASGDAMVLNLAKDFASNPTLRYNIAFVFFSGEEAGLLGSRYFSQHPVFPLAKVKVWINLDMVGTGEDGITIVNGTIFKEYFNTLKQINDSCHLLKEIKARGEARNSDHYYLYAKGVPALFIYTRGTDTHYHSPLDRPETLSLAKYNELYLLIKRFTLSLQK